jgi:hypothetical protein
MVVPQAALIFGFIMIAAAVVTRFALEGDGKADAATPALPDSTA